MKAEQKKIYDDIKARILIHRETRTPQCPIFVKRRPGRGKTYLLDTLACDLRSQQLVVLIVGTSALAATLYEGGRTAHNLFQIPVCDASIAPVHLQKSIDELFYVGKHNSQVEDYCGFSPSRPYTR